MNIDFIKGKIKKINLEIVKSFNNLPPDRNEKSKGYYFRFRRFSKVIFKDGIFKKEVGVNFFQKKKINRFAGGKNRKFLNINKIVLDKIIELIKKNFINYLNPKKTIELEFINSELNVEKIMSVTQFLKAGIKMDLNL